MPIVTLSRPLLSHVWYTAVSVGGPVPGGGSTGAQHPASTRAGGSGCGHGCPSRIRVRCEEAVASATCARVRDGAPGAPLSRRVGDVVVMAAAGPQARAGPHEFARVVRRATSGEAEQ